MEVTNIFLINSIGEDFWTVIPAETEHNWREVRGLRQGVTYELKVIAYNGESPDAPSTSSALQRVRIGMKRGRTPSWACIL